MFEGIKEKCCKPTDVVDVLNHTQGQSNLNASPNTTHSPCFVAYRLGACIIIAYLRTSGCNSKDIKFFTETMSKYGWKLSIINFHERKLVFIKKKDC